MAARRWVLLLTSSAALAAEPVPRAATPDALPADAGAPAVCALQHGVDRATTPSSACTTCHGAMQGAFEHGGHRVEVEYVARTKDLKAKPEAQGLNVVLPSGRITCTTCHDPASKLPSHVAAPTDGPVAKRMCVACHEFS